MPTAQECVCFQEVQRVMSRINTSDSEPDCIIEHEGFDPVFLNTWVLQTAYLKYRQWHGTSESDSIPPHEWASNIILLMEKFSGHTLPLQAV